MKRLLQVLVGLSLLAGIGWASRHAYPINPQRDAMLRLSWRMRGEAIRRCRERTEEELEELPEHMRMREVCEGSVSSYTLRLRIDGGALPTTTHRAAGAHADRPIYVFREVKLKPGQHDIHVEFTSDIDPTHSRMNFAQTVTVAADQIVLITTDANATGLIVR